MAVDFTGVVAVASSECQQQAGSIVDGYFKPLHALLFFCGEDDLVVRLPQPVVEGVWLDLASSDAKPGWDSAVLYVGGSASVVMEAGRFEHNHAGFALLLAGNTRTNISSTVVTGNMQGGIALKANASARISSSNLTGNSAAFGAGLYAAGSSSVVLAQGTLIANNTAENKGGGIYAKDAAAITCESGSAVDINRARQDGAGLTLEDRVRAVLTNCSVSRNAAAGTSAGGILASDNSTVELKACKLDGNKAGKQGGAVALQADSDKCKVGGLFACRPSLRMFGSFMRNNSASVQGGGIYIGPGAFAAVSGSIITGNTARNGGGVHVRGNDASVHAAELVLDSTLQQSTVLEGNAAENAGGVNVYGDEGSVSKCMVKVFNSIFAANTASQGGGGIVANARCSVVAQGAVMRDNSAGKVGGAFSVTGGVSLSMYDVKLLRNTAQMAGAGYLGGNASVLISSSMVEGNVASHDGGAFALADTAQLKLSGNTELVANIAAVSGGGVAAADSASVAFDVYSVCRNNGAEANGGCVHLLDRAKVSFSNRSTCRYNMARTAGGCICAVSNSSAYVDRTSRVYLNRARVGGGVALLGTAPTNDAALLRPVVNNNTATDMGDNVYVDLVHVTLFVQSIASNTDGVLTHSELQQRGPVVGYVSRSVGPGLNATIIVMSNGSSAGSGVRVEASVLSSSSGALQYYSTAITDANGRVVFANISPQLTPGTHTLLFVHNTVSGTPARESFPLAVRGCVRGEVTRGTSTTCDECAPGSYSLGVTAAYSKECLEDVCDSTATCRGGAVVMPLPRVYQRSPSFAVFQR
jgi:predicted outer membrane repeat protein